MQSVYLDNCVISTIHSFIPLKVSNAFIIFYLKQDYVIYFMLHSCNTSVVLDKAFSVSFAGRDHKQSQEKDLSCSRLLLTKHSAD